MPSLDLQRKVGKKEIQRKKGRLKTDENGAIKLTLTELYSKN